MRFKFRMWKASWIILIGFLVTFALDLISTFSVGELVKFMETNPIYIYGGWVPVFLLNMLALYIFLKGYDSKNITNRFSVISSFFYLMVMRIFVIYNNFKLGVQVQSGEITQAMVEGTSSAVKVNHYLLSVILGIALPIIFSIIIYFIFKLDHKIEINE